MKKKCLLSLLSSLYRPSYPSIVIIVLSQVVGRLFLNNRNHENLVELNQRTYLPLLLLLDQ